MSLKWLTPISLGFTVGTIILDVSLKSKVFNYHDKVTEPPKTSIIIPTLNEEAYLSECLHSLESQNVLRKYPEKFETIIVDGGSIDATLRIAEKYGADKIIQVPKGKLTARHKGTLASKGHVIVGVDADTYYPPNYLSLTLKHFRNPQVVGVTSPRLYGRDSNIILNTARLWGSLIESAQGRVAGSNSSFLKGAYFRSGGLNLNINQFDAYQIVQEEEYAFPSRLRRIGKVVWEWLAPSFTSARRWTHAEPQKRSFMHETPILLYPE